MATFSVVTDVDIDIELLQMEILEQVATVTNVFCVTNQTSCCTCCPQSTIDIEVTVEEIGSSVFTGLPITFAGTLNPGGFSGTIRATSPATIGLSFDGVTVSNHQLYFDIACLPVSSIPPFAFECLGVGGMGWAWTTMVPFVAYENGTNPDWGVDFPAVQVGGDGTINYRSNVYTYIADCLVSCDPFLFTVDYPIWDVSADVVDWVRLGTLRVTVNAAA